MELFHATDMSSALSIDKSRRFRPGRHGFAGPAIYFSRREEGACRKFRNGTGNPDVVIRCRVDLGNVLQADKHTMDGPSCRRKGYDSIKVYGLDVFAVYDADRISILGFKRAGGWFWIYWWFPSMQELLNYEEGGLWGHFELICNSLGLEDTSHRVIAVVIVVIAWLCFVVGVLLEFLLM
eukprot:TRINITY_DN1378_c1_g2_i1.p1 TRINITY_DN1378_c1_g2~~TRINITY_DN1378_c1_g2_i1.p1  ORF type:complete len:180 (-),score=10.34 TRINITY_DN1378_c1_g2_i1:161-700(-)